MKGIISMKNYVRPELEIVRFASENITDIHMGGVSGDGWEEIPED